MVAWFWKRVSSRLGRRQAQIVRLTGDRLETYGEWSSLRVLRQHMQILAEQGLLEPVFEGHSYQLPMDAITVE